MKSLYKKIWLGLIVMFWCLWLLPTSVRAQNCGGDCSVVPTNCREVCYAGYCENVCDYQSSCSGSCQSVDCPPGQYKPPNSWQCVDIAGSCACGEFYACPTESNPDRQCPCCPTETACRNARVDCPPGTARTNTVVSTTCEKIDGVGICGGIGSAQTRSTLV